MLAVVVLVVSRAAAPPRAADEAAESAERAELEAARDAKYREIRDAELDYRTGKLSEADWRAHRPRAARRGGGDPARLDDLPTSTAPNVPRLTC